MRYLDPKNAAKAYVRQADWAAGYAELQPVFSLNLVNQVKRLPLKHRQAP